MVMVMVDDEHHMLGGISRHVTACLDQKFFGEKFL
jgi:hypothetical protein